MHSITLLTRLPLAITATGTTMGYTYYPVPRTLSSVLPFWPRDSLESPYHFRQHFPPGFRDWVLGPWVIPHSLTYHLIDLFIPLDSYM